MPFTAAGSVPALAIALLGRKHNRFGGTKKKGKRI